MALLDVNALVALVWDSHVHHARIREWFTENSGAGWSTCPITESGFVRVSANPRILPSPIGIDGARRVLGSLRSVAGHSFLVDDVSITDNDVPAVAGYRQVTDVHLLTLARPEPHVHCPTPHTATRTGAGWPHSSSAWWCR